MKMKLERYKDCICTGADKVAAKTVAEIVKHTITMLLRHASMNVVARIAEFGNFFGQKFDTLSWVAKNDRLIDLQLGKQRV